MTDDITQQTAQALTDAALSNQFDHAFAVLGEARTKLMAGGITPASMASALSASFINHIAVMTAYYDLAPDTIVKACVESIEMMESYATEVYGKVKARMQQEGQGANDLG